MNTTCLYELRWWFAAAFLAGVMFGGVGVLWMSMKELRKGLDARMELYRSGKRI